MSYYQCQAFHKGEHVIDVFQYDHQVCYWLENILKGSMPCDVVLIEKVRGEYHRALLTQLKDMKEVKKNE